MGWIATLLTGALIGWLAGKVTDVSKGLFLNMLIGVLGSGLGRWLFGEVLGIGKAYNAGHFSLSGVVFGVMGAVVLIAALRALGLLSSR